jgi:hypothetical protein
MRPAFQVAATLSTDIKGTVQRIRSDSDSDKE